MREGASLLNWNAALCLSCRGGRIRASVSELQMREGNNLLSVPLPTPLRGKCISLICNSTSRMYVQGEGTRKVAQSMLRQMRDSALSLPKRGRAGEGDRLSIQPNITHPNLPSGVNVLNRYVTLQSG